VRADERGRMVVFGCRDGGWTRGLVGRSPVGRSVGSHSLVVALCLGRSKGSLVTRESCTPLELARMKIALCHWPLGRWIFIYQIGPL